MASTSYIDQVMIMSALCFINAPTWIFIVLALY